MGQFGSMPYFKGAVESKQSGILSQPTSLASRMGTKASTKKTKSESSDVPKALTGETLAYMLRGEKIKQGMYNIRMDMVKDLESRGGFSSANIAAVNKKYGKQLAEIYQQQRLHEANKYTVEKRSEEGFKTIDKLSSTPGSLAADQYGNILKDEKTGKELTHFDIIKHINNDEYVNDYYRTYKPIDLEKLDNDVKAKLNAPGNLSWSADTNSIIKLTNLMRSGADLNDPSYQNIINAAVTSGSGNTAAVNAALSDVRDLFKTDTEMGRAFNYKFNLYKRDLKRTAETVPPKGNSEAAKNIRNIIKQAKRNIAQDEDVLRMQYTSDYLQGKKVEVLKQDQNLNYALLNSIDKSKARGNSYFAHLINDDTPFGLSRMSTTAIIANRASASNENWNYLFDPEKGYYNDIGKDALNILEKGTDRISLGIDDEAKREEVFNLMNEFRSELDVSRGNQQQELNIKRAFQVAYLKVMEPEKYILFNSLGATDTRPEEVAQLAKKLDSNYNEVYGDMVKESDKILRMYSMFRSEVFQIPIGAIDPPERYTVDSDGRLFSPEQLFVMGRGHRIKPVPKNEAKNFLAVENNRVQNDFAEKIYINNKELSGSNVIVKNVTGVSFGYVPQGQAEAALFKGETLTNEQLNQRHLVAQVVLTKDQVDEFFKENGGEKDIASITRGKMINGKWVKLKPKSTEDNFDEAIENMGGSVYYLTEEEAEEYGLPRYEDGNLTKLRKYYTFNNTYIGYSKDQGDNDIMRQKNPTDINIFKDDYKPKTVMYEVGTKKN